MGIPGTQGVSQMARIRGHKLGTLLNSGFSP